MRYLAIILSFFFITALPVQSFAEEAADNPVVVYKNPWCGCCGGWVDHMRKNGFEVTVYDVEDLDPIKSAYNVPDSLQSCHSAKIGGYTIEGHVPARDILRLLSEKPEIVGLSVPGMVAGSPGMGSGSAPYQVISFSKDGAYKVYAQY
jgi:hypothetical protein